jgi:hypothetical protein
MSENDKVEWTVHRPRSTSADLANLAEELKVFYPAFTTTAVDPEGENVVLTVPIKKTKPGKTITGDIGSLQNAVVFVPSSQPPASSASQSDTRTKGIFLTIDPTDSRVSHIEDVFRKADGNGNVMYHRAGGRMMHGGKFVGGSQVESTKTPGLMYFNGAKFMESRHWNPDHPDYKALLDTSTTTELSGSKSSKGVTSPDTAASVLANSSKHNRAQNPSAGSLKKADRIKKPPDGLSNLFGTYNLITHLVRDEILRKTSNPSSVNPTSHLPQASSNANVPSHYSPTNTNTTRQGEQSGDHSYNPTVLSQSADEQEKLGDQMLKDGAEKFFRARRQD